MRVCMCVSLYDFLYVLCVYNVCAYVCTYVCMYIFMCIGSMCFYIMCVLMFYLFKCCSEPQQQTTPTGCCLRGQD